MEISPHYWNALLEMRDAPAHLFLRLDSAYALGVPKTALAPGQLEAMKRLVKEHAPDAIWT